MLSIPDPGVKCLPASLEAVVACLSVFALEIDKASFDYPAEKLKYNNYSFRVCDETKQENVYQIEK